jgi:hypothetical protein
MTKKLGKEIREVTRRESHGFWAREQADYNLPKSTMRIWRHHMAADLE